MTNKTKIILVISIIFLAAGSRLVDHPANFTPIAAMALFAGCYLGRKWGIVFPLAAMLVSDYFIGFYEWQVMLSVYLGLALAFVLGWYLQNRVKLQNVVLASLASSFLFFLITNFAVWAFFSWYPHTLQGLINCYVLAIPFFRNTLFGDLFYAGALFGAYEFVLRFSEKKILGRVSS
ncbi:hypothetical protein A3J77_00845 [Candidatus Wolfebacteria bacterium RBG_13_41_7]|uniref:Rod shape-determining protein MreD n=1 Tax=Candidatus Wolfebacteria bacterium RBG_13_41_7 TaxID=1802554 RepID=A0A1F8DKD9_9BACT|nr:MAG: hypothetical protein A3J77_00845 [Candidatus Wolfebacteria bacterium RBG_13_41_7]